MELVLRPRPLRYFLLAILAAAMIAVGVYFFIEGRVMDRILMKIVGVAIVIFFGAAFFMFSSALIPRGAYLRLDDAGFTICSVFTPRRLRWNEVYPFEVSKESKGRKLVVFDYTSKYRGQRPKRKPAVKAEGYDAFLPDSYGRSPEELAALMNEWRARGVK
jgi:hypothetical protein